MTGLEVFGEFVFGAMIVGTFGALIALVSVSVVCFAKWLMFGKRCGW